MRTESRPLGPEGGGVRLDMRQRAGHWDPRGGGMRGGQGTWRAGRGRQASGEEEGDDTTNGGEEGDTGLQREEGPREPNSWPEGPWAT